MHRMLASGFVVATLVVSRVHAATPAQVCRAAKEKATAAKVTAKLRCNATATTKGQPPDQGCLDRAEARFAAIWQKIEAKGGCAATGDAATIEQKVDAFVGDVVATLTPTTTTTSSCPTTTSSLPPCNGVGSCSGFCPSPQQCLPSGGSGPCGCVGPPQPCGSVVTGLCQFGDCPPGMQCVAQPAGPPTCGLGCICQ